MATTITHYTATGSLQKPGGNPAGVQGQELAALRQARNDERQRIQRSANDDVVTLGQAAEETPTYAPPVTSGYAPENGQSVPPVEAPTSGVATETATGTLPLSVANQTGFDQKSGSTLTSSPPAASSSSFVQQPLYTSLPFDPTGVALPSLITINNAPTVSDLGQFALHKSLIDHSRFGVTLGEGASITVTQLGAGQPGNDSTQVSGNGLLSIKSTIVNNGTGGIILGAGAKVTYNYITEPSAGQDQIQVANNGSLSINSSLVNNSRNLMIIGDGAEVTFNFRINGATASDSIFVKDNGALSIDLKSVNNRNTLFEVGANAKVTINGEVSLDTSSDSILVANNGNLSIRAGYVDNRNSLYRFAAGQEVTLNGSGVYDSVVSTLQATGRDRVVVNSREQLQPGTSRLVTPPVVPAPVNAPAGPQKLSSSGVPLQVATNDNPPGAGLDKHKSAPTVKGQQATENSVANPQDHPLDFSSLRIVPNSKDLSYLTATSSGEAKSIARGYGKQRDNWQLIVKNGNGRFGAEV